MTTTVVSSKIWPRFKPLKNDSVGASRKGHRSVRWRNLDLNDPTPRQNVVPIENSFVNNDHRGRERCPKLTPWAESLMNEVDDLYSTQSVYQSVMEACGDILSILWMNDSLKHVFVPVSCLFYFWSQYSNKKTDGPKISRDNVGWLMFWMQFHCRVQQILNASCTTSCGHKHRIVPWEIRTLKRLICDDHNGTD